MNALNPDAYSHGRHIARVQAAAREIGIRGSAFAVLAYLCASADFGKPIVIRAKETICEKTGYSLRPVKAALKTLREAGLIEAVAYETGGRNRATVYCLRTGKGVTNDPPLSTKGGHFVPQKGVTFGSERGSLSAPPSTDHSNDPSRVKGPAQGRGGAYRPLDAGQGASTGAAHVLTEAEKEESFLFSKEHRENGMTEALKRARARKAAKEKGLGNGEG